MTRRLIGTPVAVALLLAAVITSLLVACGSDGDDDVDTSNVDAGQLLAAAADRLESVGSFHFELDHENGTASIVRGLDMQRAEGDVMAADLMQLLVEAEVGPIKVEVEMIILPGEGWITNPLTGRWEREDIDVAQFFDPGDGVTALMRLVEGAEVAGTDNIDGVDSYRIEAIVDSALMTLFGNARAGRELALTAWIGIDDPLVQRIDIEGGIVADEPDDLIRRLTFSQFGADFDIKAPR